MEKEMEYIAYGELKTIWPKITSNRLKRWRDGRGDAKRRELRVRKINDNLFLYNREDIKILLELLEKKGNNYVSRRMEQN